MPIASLLQLGRQLQRELRADMLTVDPALVAAQLPPDANASFGSCRVLEQSRYGFFSPNETLLGIWGGGCWYSFVARSACGDGPQLLLQTGLDYGGAGMDLGAIGCGDVPRDAAAGRTEWTVEQRDRWRALWLDRRPAQQRCRELGTWRNAFHPLDPVVGHSYGLRLIHEGSSDVLVAVTVVARDEESVSLVWQLLREWPIAEAPAHVALNQRYVDGLSPASPAWLKELRTHELLAELSRVREAAKPRLFDVSAAHANAAPARPGRGGVTRLLRDGELDTLVARPGGGAYFSFARGAHGHSLESDLELRGNTYGSAWTGGEPELLVDLGAIDLDALDGAAPPSSITAHEREVWNIAWRVRRAAPGDEGYVPGQVLSSADAERVKRLRARDVPAVVGHTYLLRAIRDFGEPKHDVTVAFRTLAIDEYGHTIAWKLLRELPTDERAR